MVTEIKGGTWFLVRCIFRVRVRADVSRARSSATLFQATAAPSPSGVSRAAVSLPICTWPLAAAYATHQFTLVR